MNLKFPSRRVVSLLVLGICGVVFASLLVVSTAREPVFEGRTATEWFELVKNGGIDLQEFERVFEGLGPESIPYVLAEPDSLVDSLVVKYLRLSEWIPTGLRAFLETTPDGDYVTEQGEVFGIIGRPAIKVLQDWIESPNPKHREACVCGIGSLIRRGHRSDVFIPTLTKLLKDEDAMVRWRSAKTISRIGPKAKEAVSSLISMLDEENGRLPGETIWTRAIAADALGRIGRSASDAIPKLTEITKDQHTHTAFRALVAIIRISPDHEQVVDLIGRMWGRLENEQRLTTSKILSELHPQVREGTLPVLLDSATSSDAGTPQLSDELLEERRKN